MPILKEDPLKTYNGVGTVDFGKVKDEVEDAMKFDWKRDKVDDAKKRAIYAAHNYDDFKQRVAGCTLKPIHRQEFNMTPKFHFNRQADTGGYAGPPRPYAVIDTAPAKIEVLRSGGDKSSGSTAVPQNSGQFERALRRCASKVEEVELLERLDGDAYAKLFGKDMDAEVLRRLLLDLEEVQRPGMARHFMSELATWCPSSVTRATSFFGPEERGLVARLLARDSSDEFAPGAGDDVRICACLGVPPCAVVAAAAAAMTPCGPPTDIMKETEAAPPASPAAPAVAGAAPTRKAPSYQGRGQQAAEQTSSPQGCDEMD